jgi:hypothetical protein
LILMVWCCVRFLHLGDSLFLEVREIFSYHSIETFVSDFSL